MSANINIEMQIMQDNLCDLRKIAGWTAETLARKLDITKQTISNLENQKVKLSRIQYIAIRAIFECEIAINPNNTTLQKVMKVLFYAIPPVYTKYKDELRTVMLSIASISAAGIEGLQLYSSAVALLAPLGRIVNQANSSQVEKLSLMWLLEDLENSDVTEEKNSENTEKSEDEDS